MKMTIFYGKQRPLVAIGENQCRVLSFAEKYPGWHTYAKDRATSQAVDALEKRGSLTVNRWARQFKINLP